MGDKKKCNAEAEKMKSYVVRNTPNGKRVSVLIKKITEEPKEKTKNTGPTK